MTISELTDTLIALRKGLAYRIWRQASLIGMAFTRKFPTSAEDAVPELYSRKGIPMPDFLMNDYAKTIGGSR